MTLIDTETASGSTSASPAPPRRGLRTAVVAGCVAALGAVAATLALGGDPRPAGEDGGVPAAVPTADQPAEPGGRGQADAAPSAGAQPDGPAAAVAPLSWAPPELDDPEVVEITEDNSQLELDPRQDYVLVLPDEPLEVPGGVTVVGGRDVVLIGGEIRVPDTGEDEGNSIRALFLRDQTGTVHVEGVALTGDGLGEGINLDQREGAVVQLQNIRVGEVFGSQEGHHGDLVQSWAGPRRLLVDGLSGSTGYQGLFLLPQQFGEQPEPELFDLRRVDITGVDGSGYLLWRDDRSWPLETRDVHVVPDGSPEDREDFLWDREGEDSWADVEVGAPADGPFVPEGVAGTGYTSPGYGEQG